MPSVSAIRMPQEAPKTLKLPANSFGQRDRAPDKNYFNLRPSFVQQLSLSLRLHATAKIIQWVPELIFIR